MEKYNIYSLDRVNIIAADDLVVNAVRASAGIILI